MRQLLVESAVLAVAASALGCAFAYFGMKVVGAAVPHKGQSVGGEAIIGPFKTAAAPSVGRGRRELFHARPSRHDSRPLHAKIFAEIGLIRLAGIWLLGNG